jgi:hypothetical protein
VFVGSGCRWCECLRDDHLLFFCAPPKVLRVLLWRSFVFSAALSACKSHDHCVTFHTTDFYEDTMQTLTPSASKRLEGSYGIRSGYTDTEL